jgi:hypothetical protein
MNSVPMPACLGNRSVIVAGGGGLLGLLLAAGCAAPPTAVLPVMEPVAARADVAWIAADPAATVGAPTVGPVIVGPGIAPAFMRPADTSASVNAELKPAASLTQPVRALPTRAGSAAPRASGAEAVSPKSTAKPPDPMPASLPTTRAAAQPTPASPLPLDFSALKARLKGTSAIGIFSKLALQNQIEDLLERFRDFHRGQLKTSLAELRRPYDLLVLKVLALLQDADPALASAIVASREPIWGILADREKFASI